MNEFLLNLISVIGSICSILSFIGISLFLNKKTRAEIYQDDNSYTVDVYIHCLNTNESWFAKSENLKNNKEFKRRGFIYSIKNREIQDEEFGGIRKGQTQSQYISFFGICVKHAVKKHTRNLKSKGYKINYIK